MKNAKGSIFYGLHFYPGVAEYAEPGKDPFRVFLNENTLRSMDASFAGRPVYVHHVDEVESDLNELRKEADGWVVESFYNAADGKHWVKMVVCSERGEDAVRKGYKLSNCYVPKQFGNGGLWNGVSYEKEVTGGEYEHLAIVPNPRYEESIILTPEEFKAYNEEKKSELTKIANAKGDPMFFKRTKVENAIDLEGTMVQLPKSKRELALKVLVNEMDEHEMKKSEPQMANDEHQVEVGGSKMKVSELKDCYNSLMTEHQKLKDSMKNEDAPEDAGVAEEEAPMPNAEEKEVPAEVKPEKDSAVEEEKKKNAKEKADKLRNAKDAPAAETPSYDPFASSSRGKSRYGSN